MAGYQFKLTPPEKDTARFWSYADQSGGPDSCWLWKGGSSSSGYGVFHMNPGERSVGAHRMAYFLGHGVDPGSLFVCHRCDVKSCVNPAHLFAATQKENQQDCIAKGRKKLAGFCALPPELVKRGEQANCSKLKEADVIEIRRLRASGGWTYHRLAAKFGVNPSIIGDIVNRKIWKHI